MRDERGEVKPKAMRGIHARCVKISRIEAEDGWVGGKNRIKQDEFHPRIVGSRFAIGVNRCNERWKFSRASPQKALHRMKSYLSYLFVLLMPLSFMARGQGRFIYDQQSATETTGGGGAVSIQSNQPLGQSFTPTLSSIGFIRLFVQGASGAILFVNLRTNSVTGPVLGFSDQVSLSSLFTGYTNFSFSTLVAVVRGATYYFQPVLQSGGGTVIAYSYNYSGGTAFEQGISQPAVDLWFREGIVVPEPSLAELVSLGIGILFYVRQKKNQKRAVR